MLFVHTEELNNIQLPYSM